MQFLKNPWVKLLVGALFLGLVFFLLRRLNIDFSQVTTDVFREKINSYGIWGPIVYIIFYFLRPLILFPAAILSASAGAIWGLKGFLYLQIAANLSANGEFLLARYFARKVVTKFVKGKMLNIDKAIERHGFLTVLLIRLIPNVAWDIQNLGLGLTKVKFKDHFFATLIGIIPGSFALVYFGSSIISVLANPKNFWMIILAVLIFVAVYFLQNYLRKRHSP